MDFQHRLYREIQEDWSKAAPSKSQRNGDAECPGRFDVEDWSKSAPSKSQRNGDTECPVDASLDVEDWSKSAPSKSQINGDAECPGRLDAEDYRTCKMLSQRRYSIQKAD